MNGDDRVVVRYYARGKWVAESPLHLGGGEGRDVDMALLRDAEGRFFIPAASLAGAGRSYLARRMQSCNDFRRGKEPVVLCNLFGGAEAGEEPQGEVEAETGAEKPACLGWMSSLLVEDACRTDATVAVRDGVRIDPETGTAFPRAKFDLEILEPGTAFELNLEVVVRGEEADAEVFQAFASLLGGFRRAEIRLGARTRRGYGRGKVASWEVRRLDLSEREGVFAWLEGDPWKRPAYAWEGQELCEDQRRFFRIEASFDLKTSLLVRSYSEHPGEPDMVHLRTAGRSVLPGTSLAGTIRHRAARIARVLGWENPEDRLEALFGPIKPEKDDASWAWAGRVWMEEAVLERVSHLVQGRVAIDRFTGGAMPSALFDEAAVWPEKEGPHLRLEICLEEPADAEIGLFLLVLKDLWLGDLPLGGETGVGRGVLQGRVAELTFQDGGSVRRWKLCGGGSGTPPEKVTLEGDDPKSLENFVGEAVKWGGE